MGPEADARWRRWILFWSGVVIVDGVVVTSIALAGREPVDPALGLVALGVVVAAPGVIALLGLHDRPHLWLVAGIAAVPLAFLSFAGVTLPLLPAAVVFCLAWARYGTPDRGRPRLHPAVVTVLVVGLLVAAVVALFASDDPASWTTASGGGSTSDVITNSEAIFSLAAAVAALATSWVSARPRRA